VRVVYWLGFLRIAAILGIFGVILVVEGDITARVIGSVMLVAFMWFVGRWLSRRSWQ
jgi:hypothetical protein